MIDVLKIENVLPYLNDGWNSSTELLQKMNMCLSIYNYEELKHLMTCYNCEPKIVKLRSGKRSGYNVNIRGIREQIAEESIKLCRGVE